MRGTVPPAFYDDNLKALRVRALNALLLFRIGEWSATLLTLTAHIIPTLRKRREQMLEEYLRKVPAIPGLTELCCETESFVLENFPKADASVREALVAANTHRLKRLCAQRHYRRGWFAPGGCPPKSAVFMPAVYDEGYGAYKASSSDGVKGLPPQITCARTFGSFVPVYQWEDWVVPCPFCASLVLTHSSCQWA